MTRRSTSDNAARDARDDDDDANFPNEAYARDISLETGESRSGTPPIPPLPPAEYEAMIRAQRAVGRAMRTTGAGTDSDFGIGRSDVSAEARVSGGTNDEDEDDDDEDDHPDAVCRAAARLVVRDAGAESSSVVDVHFDVLPRALRRVAASCAAARRAAETLAPDAAAEESDAPSTTATA